MYTDSSLLTYCVQSQITVRVPISRVPTRRSPVPRPVRSAPPRPLRVGRGRWGGRAERRNAALEPRPSTRRSAPRLRVRSAIDLIYIGFYKNETTQNAQKTYTGKLSCRGQAANETRSGGIEGKEKNEDRIFANRSIARTRRVQTRDTIASINACFEHFHTCVARPRVCFACTPYEPLMLSFLTIICVLTVISVGEN